MCNHAIGLKDVTTVLERKFLVYLETVEPWNRGSIGFKIEKVDRVLQGC